MAIPDFLGFSDPDVNAGKMSTKGYELNVSWNDHIGDFSYGIAINFSDFTSKWGIYKEPNSSVTKLKWKAVNSMSGMAMLAMVFS